MTKTRLDPRIYANQNILLAKSHTPTLFKKTTSINKNGQKLSLRFKTPLENNDLAGFEKHEIRIQSALQTIYIAFVPWTALPFLESHPKLEYAESLSFTTSTNHPSATISKSTPANDIGVTATHLDPRGSTGEGKIVADIDSGIDVLHPHFFFADGKRLQWLDINENNLFDVEIDGIDLNRDGEISENERLKIAFGIELVDTEVDAQFKTRRDWLYLDRNKDGKRNAGTDEGFSEEDPAYGEPIFVVEDVNRNDLLDVHEVLVQLGTSKIVKFVTKDGTYERGVNLISATSDPAENDFGHGTSVASILVGGQFGFHDAVGVAPHAEIVMYRAESEDSSYAFAAVMDAIESDYDVILHEWTESIVSPIDGSGNYEAIMGLAYSSGIPSINPLGNLNDSGKHLQKKGEGENALSFKIGEGFSGNIYNRFLASIFWLNDEKPTFSLVDPNGQSYAIDSALSPQQFGNLNLQTTISTSPRGTHQFTMSAWTSDETALPIGEWTLNVNGLNGTFVGRIGDVYSGWAKGIQWTNPTTDRGSIVYPATADSAFGVAAIDIENSTGRLRNFSGLGPRIDGARVVDLSAPDDPLTAFAASKNRIQSGLGRTWFTTFGGTSGASPHVAGSYLLLQSLSPDLTPAQIEGMLENTADTNGDLGEFGELPNARLGAGKLNIYNAIFKKPTPRGNRPPVAQGKIIDGLIDSEGSNDPDGDPVQVRYDFNHDGIFDTAWLEPGIIGLPETWKSTDIAHLQVRDLNGYKNGLLLLETTALPRIVGLKGGGFCQAAQTTDPQIGWVLGLLIIFLLASPHKHKRRS